MTYDYAIIGAGISGVTFARLLQQAGKHNFIILEQSDTAGGLCQSQQVGGHTIDLGGGHFLCTKYPEVYDFIFRHIPQSEFNYFDRISKINVGGTKIDYPLESNIWQLPSNTCAEFLISIIQNGESRGVPAPQDFEAWCRWKLGDRVTDHYMIPYNRKVWGVMPKEMDIDWLHKIPRLNIQEITTACLTQRADRDKMPSHSGFYYPKFGGFQRVFDAIADPVRDNIRTGFRVKDIERTRSGLSINGDVVATRIINTAPWEALQPSSLFPEEIRKEISKLRYSGLVVSLEEKQHETGTHWCYEPSLDRSYHREFYIKNYAADSRINGVMKETNVARWTGSDAHIFSTVNKHAYPVPSLGWASSIDRILSYAESQQVFGLGRWGQWKYLNSDVCIWEAMQLAKRLSL